MLITLGTKDLKNAKTNSENLLPYLSKGKDLLISLPNSTSSKIWSAN